MEAKPDITKLVYPRSPPRGYVLLLKVHGVGRYSTAQGRAPKFTTRSGFWWRLSLIVALIDPGCDRIHRISSRTHQRPRRSGCCKTRAASCADSGGSVAALSSQPELSLAQALSHPLAGVEAAAAIAEWYSEGLAGERKDE